MYRAMQRKLQYEQVNKDSELKVESPGNTAVVERLLRTKIHDQCTVLK